MNCIACRQSYNKKVYNIIKRNINLQNCMLGQRIGHYVNYVQVC